MGLKELSDGNELTDKYTTFLKYTVMFLGKFYDPIMWYRNRC